MGMESSDEFATREPDQARRGSRGPRLVINEMVMRNFKSYAGEQRVGPFHKVRVLFLIFVINLIVSVVFREIDGNKEGKLHY